MRGWAFILGGLVIWTAHFFALYAIGSIFPGSPTASWLTVAVTLPAIAADVLVIWLAAKHLRNPDQLDRWIAQIGATGAVISLVAVIWQGLPGII